MTTSWEKVYIFISSTFNDMHGERDYLVKRVFPELQDWCERRKLRLADIDLRWGVTEQDATHNRNIVKVCLSRIDDCRPFFLCFLGQRRGWVPKRNEISDETFANFPDLRPIVGAASVTEMEILHALITPLHQSLLRDTAKRAEYFEPAKYSFFFLRDPSYLEQLPADPSTLRETYTNEWIEDAAEREKHDRELKKWREIEIPYSNRPVHSYQAKWYPNALTPEVMQPLQCPSAEPANIERWQKQWQKAGVTVMGLDIEDDPVQASKAREFNNSLSAGRLSDFKCEDARLSRIIIRELQEAITGRYPDHSEVERENDLQKEIDQQEQFLFTAGEGFIEREGDFTDLDDYVESDSNELFVLTAVGGMGKSTLLANWGDRYRKRIEGRSDHSIHFRFIGQSDGTTTVYSLLRLLLCEIKEIAHKFDEELPLDPVELLNEWPALLEAIGQRGKTVIVIDALNQLESGLTDVGWLPRHLSDNIKLIVSFKRGDPPAEELYQRFREGNQVRLSEVKPFENLVDRRRLVWAYLSQYLKELDEQPLETLINLRGAENPLYLNVVLSELRVFGTYSNLAVKIRSDFGDNPVSAFTRVLARLEHDPAYSPIDPKLGVPLLFGLLAHARRGLSVEELTSLFIQALELDDTEQSREGAADTVNLLLRQVRSFLARREGRYDFFFESFKIAAQHCYVADGNEATISRQSYPEWHRLLARYFQSLPTWRELPALSHVESVRDPMVRKVSELAYHQTQARQWAKLEETLCDLDFIEAKCTARMTDDLLAEYAAGAPHFPAGEAEDIKPFARFIQDNAAFVRRHPKYMRHRMVMEARESPVAVAARRLFEASDSPYLEPVRARSKSAAHIIRLAGHTNPVEILRCAPGQADLFSWDGTEFLIWNSVSGAITRRPGLTASCKVTVPGYNDSVRFGISRDGSLYRMILARGDPTLELDGDYSTPLVIAPNESTIAFGITVKSRDRRTLEYFVYLIDARSSVMLGRLPRKQKVTGCCFSPDSKFLATIQERWPDKDIRAVVTIWNVQDQRILHQFETQGSFWVSPKLEFSADGDWLFASDIHTIYACSMQDESQSFELVDFKEHTKGLAVDPNGNSWLISWGSYTVTLWDLPNRRIKGRLDNTKNFGEITAFAFLQDQERFALGFWDGRIEIWGGEALVPTSLEPSESPPFSRPQAIVTCDISPDGTRVITGRSPHDGVSLFNTGLTEEVVRRRLLDDQQVESSRQCRFSADGESVLMLSVASRRPDPGSQFAHFSVLRRLAAQDLSDVAVVEGESQRFFYNLKESADGALNVVFRNDRSLLIYEAPELRLYHVLQIGGNPSDWSLSPDGRYIVWCSRDELQIWDTERLTARMRLDSPRYPSGTIDSRGFEKPVYSPDGRLIAVGTRQRLLPYAHFAPGISIISSCTGRELQRLDRLGAEIWEFSPDGTKLLLASEGTLALVDLNYGVCWSSELPDFPGRIDEFGADLPRFVMSRDCQFVFGIQKNYLQVWQADSGSVVVLNMMKEIESGSLGPHGSMVAVAEHGALTLLRLRNCHLDLPIITATYLYRFKKRCFDSQATAVCGWCGVRFDVPDAIVNHIIKSDSIEKWNTDDSPILRLPRETWDTPALLGCCPRCRRGNRFNPFFGGTSGD